MEARESTRPTAEPTSRSVVSHTAQVENTFKPALRRLRESGEDLRLEAHKLYPRAVPNEAGVIPVRVRYGAESPATLRQFEGYVREEKHAQQIFRHKQARDNARR